MTRLSCWLGFHDTCTRVRVDRARAHVQLFCTRCGASMVGDSFSAASRP